MVRNSGKPAFRWFAVENATTQKLEIEAPSCHQAGVVARQAGFANVGPHGVNRARRRDANLAHQGGAAIAVAPHSSALVIDERARDPIKRRVILQRESRPFG